MTRFDTLIFSLIGILNLISEISASRRTKKVTFVVRLILHTLFYTMHIVTSFFLKNSLVTSNHSFFA